jgi:predicted aspartyl protease
MSSPFALLFDHEFQYRSVPGLDASLVFPALTLGLVGPAGADDLIAIVDTGATYSLFDGRRAKSIGLDLMSGKSIRLAGLAGSLSARLHRVTLEILGSSIDCEVAFSEIDIGRELLGRHELFSRVRFGFREGISAGYFHPHP